MLNCCHIRETRVMANSLLICNFGWLHTPRTGNGQMKILEMSMWVLVYDCIFKIFACFKLILENQFPECHWNFRQSLECHWMALKGFFVCLWHVGSMAFKGLAKILMALRELALFWNCLNLRAPNLFLVFHLGKCMHPSYRGRKREG